MKTFAIFSIFFLVASAAVIKTDDNECKEDTSYPDERSCSNYYECHNGQLEKQGCPRGTFFSDDPNLLVCVAYRESGCDYTGQKAKHYLDGKTPKVYLTFDDGPGIGTKEVLDVLKANEVEATFFLMSAQIHPKVGETYSASNKQLLKRIYEEGHDLGDHSSDHMKHNSKDFTWTYRNATTDLDYFGKGNTGSIRAAFLRTHGYSARNSAKIARSMRSMARMPYTNNWRVKMTSGDVVKFNCVECSVPHESGMNGVKIADALAKTGTNVYGWDIEWSANHKENRLSNSVSAQNMLANLDDGSDSRVDNKIVVLSHDAQWAGDNNAEILDHFIKMAKMAGYQFRKLSLFPTDV
jgi:peptidoglycan/xylan/chitin deacetylase (PgdA/CDA1 family)